MLWYSLGIIIMVAGFGLVFLFLDKMRKKRVLIAGLGLILLAVILFEAI